MSTVAAIEALQGRISILQQRIDSYLGDGPAHVGLTSRRVGGTSFAGVLADAFTGGADDAFTGVTADATATSALQSVIAALWSRP